MSRSAGPALEDPAVRAWLVSLIAGDERLVVVDRACRHDPVLLRLGRHLWVRARLDAGMTVVELARESGIGRETLRGWAMALDRCQCGAVKRELASASCDSCARYARTNWTRRRLLRERDRFREELGREPKASDWNATRNPALAAGWPPATAVRRRFGSWAAFLAAEPEA